MILVFASMLSNHTGAAFPEVVSLISGLPERRCGRDLRA